MSDEEDYDDSAPPPPGSRGPGLSMSATGRFDSEGSSDDSGSDAGGPPGGGGTGKFDAAAIARGPPREAGGPPPGMARTATGEPHATDSIESSSVRSGNETPASVFGASTSNNNAATGTNNNGGGGKQSGGASPFLWGMDRAQSFRLFAPGAIGMMGAPTVSTFDALGQTTSGIGAGSTSLFGGGLAGSSLLMSSAGGGAGGGGGDALESSLSGAQFGSMHFGSMGVFPSNPRLPSAVIRSSIGQLRNFLLHTGESVGDGGDGDSDAGDGSGKGGGHDAAALGDKEKEEMVMEDLVLDAEGSSSQDDIFNESAGGMLAMASGVFSGASAGAGAGAGASGFGSSVIGGTGLFSANSFYGGFSASASASGLAPQQHQPYVFQGQQQTQHRPSMSVTSDVGIPRVSSSALWGASSSQEEGSGRAPTPPPGVFFLGAVNAVMSGSGPMPTIPMETSHNNSVNSSTPGGTPVSDAGARTGNNQQQQQPPQLSMRDDDGGLRVAGALSLESTLIVSAEQSPGRPANSATSMRNESPARIGAGDGSNNGNGGGDAQQQFADRLFSFSDSQDFGETPAADRGGATTGGLLTPLSDTGIRPPMVQPVVAAGARDSGTDSNSGPLGEGAAEDAAPPSLGRLNTANMSSASSVGKPEPPSANAFIKSVVAAAATAADHRTSSSSNNTLGGDVMWVTSAPNTGRSTYSGGGGGFGSSSSLSPDPAAVGTLANPIRIGAGRPNSAPRRTSAGGQQQQQQPSNAALSAGSKALDAAAAAAASSSDASPPKGAEDAASPTKKNRPGSGNNTKRGEIISDAKVVVLDQDGKATAGSPLVQMKQKRTSNNNNNADEPNRLSASIHRDGSGSGLKSPMGDRRSSGSASPEHSPGKASSANGGGAGGGGTFLVRGPMVGSGGFAAVYVGLLTHEEQHRMVAIKEITFDASGVEAEDLRRVASEFELLRELRHPNVIRYCFFDYSMSKAMCRIVMEYISAGSLQQVTMSGRTLPETVLRDFSQQLLEGLAFIHSHGISHRDLKPANCLLHHDGTVKLADFGCSRSVNQLVESSKFVFGSPIYMAPEQIENEIVCASDVWSLGATMLELATGKAPWHETNLIRNNLYLMFYITGHPDKIPFFADTLGTPEFRDFLRKCFTRDPAARPTAAELLAHPWIKHGPGAAAQQAIREQQQYLPHQQPHGAAALAQSLALHGPEVEELCAIQTLIVSSGLMGFQLNFQVAAQQVARPAVGGGMERRMSTVYGISRTTSLGASVSGLAVGGVTGSRMNSEPTSPISRSHRPSIGQGATTAPQHHHQHHPSSLRSGEVSEIGGVSISASSTPQESPVLAATTVPGGLSVVAQAAAAGATGLQRRASQNPSPLPSMPSGSGSFRFERTGSNNAAALTAPNMNMNNSLSSANASTTTPPMLQPIGSAVGARGAGSSNSFNSEQSGSGSGGAGGGMVSAGSGYQGSGDFSLRTNSEIVSHQQQQQTSHDLLTPTFPAVEVASSSFASQDISTAVDQQQQQQLAMQRQMSRRISQAFPSMHGAAAFGLPDASVAAAAIDAQQQLVIEIEAADIEESGGDEDENDYDLVSSGGVSPASSEDHRPKRFSGAGGGAVGGSLNNSGKVNSGGGGADDDEHNNSTSGLFQRTITATATIAEFQPVGAGAQGAAAAARLARSKSMSLFTAFGEFYPSPERGGGSPSQHVPGSTTNANQRGSGFNSRDSSRGGSPQDASTFMASSFSTASHDDNTAGASSNVPTPRRSAKGAGANTVSGAAAATTSNANAGGSSIIPRIGRQMSVSIAGGEDSLTTFPSFSAGGGGGGPPRRTASNVGMLQHPKLSGPRKSIQVAISIAPGEAPVMLNLHAEDLVEAAASTTSSSLLATSGNPFASFEMSNMLGGGGGATSMHIPHALSPASSESPVQLSPTNRLKSPLLPDGAHGSGIDGASAAAVAAASGMGDRRKSMARRKSYAVCLTDNVKQQLASAMVERRKDAEKKKREQQQLQQSSSSSANSPVVEVTTRHHHAVGGVSLIEQLAVGSTHANSIADAASAVGPSTSASDIFQGDLAGVATDKFAASASNNSIIPSGNSTGRGAAPPPLSSGRRGSGDAAALRRAGSPPPPIVTVKAGAAAAVASSSSLNLPPRNSPPTSRPSSASTGSATPPAGAAVAAVLEMKRSGLSSWQSAHPDVEELASSPPKK